MATHIVLVNFTDQGVKNVKTSPDRVDSFEKIAGDLGVKVESAHYTTGPFDIILLLDGADESVATAVLGAGTTGNVRTQVLRAFSADQMREIVSELS
ncbi:GYD domain-containing protein [Halomonas sp. C05BenzN]|uniref:GYD domain-containing protein n=1 Tax=Halomonas sp. C05BenzN TaxID=3411041 RepID=UPI003B9639D6